MMKKLLAMFTAVGCMMSALPVFAVETATEADVPEHPCGCEYFLVVDAERSLVFQLVEPDVAEAYAAYYDIPADQAASYGIGLGTIGCGADLSAQLEGQKALENGDILTMTGITSVAEVYPCCIHFEGDDEVITNLGQTDEIAESKPLTLISTDGRTDVLQDAAGEMYYFDDSGFSYPNAPAIDQFTVGDTIDFWVYENMAVCPAGASAALPALNAEREMVVVGVDDAEDPQNYVMMSTKNAKNLAVTYYLPADTAAQYLTEGTIGYGDILDVTGTFVVPAGDGTDTFTLSGDAAITILGSVFDYGTEEVYEISDRVTSYTNAWVMNNAEGKEFLSYMDFLQSGEYVQPGGVSLPDCKPGDEVTMLTYQGIPCIPVAAESSEPSGTVGVVTHIAYDENGDPKVYMLDNSIRLYKSDAEACLGTELPQYGDVLEVGCDSIDPMEPAIFNFDGYNVEDFIRNYGSAADYYGQSKVLTVTGFKYSQLVMEDADGNQYLYSTSYYSDYYDYVGNLPLDKAKIGDKLTFVMDDSRPVYPEDFSPLGDVNADNTLNVLDVVTMNRHLLTGAELPALAKARSTGETDLGQCDFNDNGTIDPDDSLCMLKRIVGLES